MKTFLAALIVALGLLALGAQSAAALSIEPVPEPASMPKSHFCKVDGERRLDGRDLVGMWIDRARRIARRSDCHLRVVQRRGMDLLVTDDLSRARLNYGVGQRRIKSFKGAF